eukprot:6586201-Pyramimonas_sp.AAC.1
MELDLHIIWIKETTREDTRPSRGPHRHRNVEGKSRKTQDIRVPLIWQGRAKHGTQGYPCFGRAGQLTAAV